MEIKISEVIRQRRRTMDISQETLADYLGVSVQAVSKWETAASYPDITLLPKIAEYLKTDINALFFGTDSNSAVMKTIPDDGKLRVVQCIGSKILSQEEYDRSKRIMLELPKNYKDQLNVEIWGSADIDGDINGPVTAGDSINCGNIGGPANAGDGINCGNISGPVSAGDGINCGNIAGPVSAGDSINCGKVAGDANAGDNIHCGDVKGSVAAGNDIYCGDIEHNAKAENDIHCHTIKGDAECGGNIIYENNQ